MQRKPLDPHPSGSDGGHDRHRLCADPRGPGADARWSATSTWATSGIFFSAFAFGPWVGAVAGGLGTALAD